jgi:hypothetical protein
VLEFGEAASDPIPFSPEKSLSENRRYAVFLWRVTTKPSFEPRDRLTLQAPRLDPVEVVDPQLAIFHPLFEPVPDHCQQGMRQRQQRSFFSAVSAQAPELCPEISVLGVGGSSRHLIRQSPPPSMAFPGAPTSPSARTLLIAGTDTSPTARVLRRRELCHVGANFRQQGAERNRVTAGQRVQQVDSSDERAQVDPICSSKTLTLCELPVLAIRENNGAASCRNPCLHARAGERSNGGHRCSPSKNRKCGAARTSKLGGIQEIHLTQSGFHFL